MGQIIGIKSGGTGRTGRAQDPFDTHIASLIGELDNLLHERRLAGRVEAAPAPAPETITAARHTAPCEAASHPAPLTGLPAARAKRARELLRQRRLRSDFLPATLFAEPAWDMLLDLYAAHYEGKPVAVSSLCIAANVPSTTALRSIDAMTRAGYLERKRDPKDARRIFLTLGDSARQGLDAYFALGD